MTPACNTNLNAALEEIRTAHATRLGELWKQHLGPQVPTLRAELMRPILAYRVQEQAHGGLRSETQKELIAALNRAEAGSRGRGEALHRFKAGTRIVREWKGETHEVILSERGYEYEGRVYQSLSPIACEITGTRWSGPAFFGTRKAVPK